MSEWAYHPECRCHYCTQIRSAGTLAGAAQGMNVDHDPAKSLLKPLPPSEKAELQVSLLNEIGLTLTAVAQTQAEQTETLKTYKLSLEGIQGLLVDNEAGIGTLGEGVAAILARLDHDSIAGLASRLAQIEERLEANEKQAVGRYERLLMLISVLHDAGQKPRKAGKRKRVKR